MAAVWHSSPCTTVFDEALRYPFLAGAARGDCDREMLDTYQEKRKGRGESGLLPAALSRREGKKLAGNVNRDSTQSLSRVFREAGNAGQAGLRNWYLLVHQPPCFDTIVFSSIGRPVPLVALVADWAKSKGCAASRPRGVAKLQIRLKSLHASSLGIFVLGRSKLRR